MSAKILRDRRSKEDFMKKRSLAAVSVLLGASLVFGMTGCGETEKEWNNKEDWLYKESPIPTETAVLPTEAAAAGSVAVHDPSVFQDPFTGTYYAFGSHFAVSSSKDLITWKQEVGDNNPKALYGTHDWRSVLKETDKYVPAGGGINSTWAPDVEYIDGTYYMYYSVTEKFGSGKSVIGRVRANDVLGPYSNEEIIVKSAGKSGEPNCIDPELFYDKDGKLWMVYGSFYGGIFIKELDETGLPVEEGFGTRIWADRGGVEGPFVFYNAAHDYYYLMTSEGDLNSDYNMRVARSKNPDGPYEDISAKNVGETRGAGNKLAGNYKFNTDGNKVALGHNSVIKKDGKYFVVMHVRNAIQGMHHLEVHQLFFNEAGWPVLSPNRYVGETAGLVSQATAAGDYEIVVHTADKSSNIINSVTHTLNADGKVLKEGAETGSWTVKQDYYVEITLDGVTYKGVIVPSWKDYGNKKGIYSITATSDTGRPLWCNGV